MSDQANAAEALAQWLRRRTDCNIEEGLTDGELARAGSTFELSMPPLWRSVLGFVHPVTKHQPPRGSDGVLRWTAYPDWRLRNVDETRELVQRPVEGLLFDVEHNDFWWHAWGARPTSLESRLHHAHEHLAGVPRLTPLWGNLYVGPYENSPVFSIVQADLYVPALTLPGLVDYISEDPVPPAEYPIGHVPFWSDLHAYSQIGHFTRFDELAQGGL